MVSSVSSVPSVVHLIFVLPIYPAASAASAVKQELLTSSRTLMARTHTLAHSVGRRAVKWIGCKGCKRAVCDGRISPRR